MKKALIIGSRGQDGRLLWDQLTATTEYEVRGLVRSAADPAVNEIECDLLNESEVRSMLRDLKPDEIYYLAAFHHSAESVRPQQSELFSRSFAVNVHGLLGVLDAVTAVSPASRILYAASSHVFGEDAPTPQNEQTPLAPTNIYGISKTAGIHACRHFRNQNGVFASVAILYNHESPFRRPEFISRKIVKGAMDIKWGKTDRLVIGNLSAEVDWGYAPDSVDAMRRILQLEKPGDFVVATGQRHSVKEFVEIVFELAGLDWRRYVKEDSTLAPTRASTLTGDSSKLQMLTGWAPTVTFREMVTALWNAAAQEETR